jgi:glycosyltransferase involved in cell wall biosynthesis
MRRHRIFYLLPYFELAGTESHLLELAKGMMERYDILVGTPYGKGVELLLRFGIPYKQLPSLTFSNVREYKHSLKFILEEFSPDIIHIHGAHELVFIAKGLSPSTPVVFTCHGYGTNYPWIDYSLSAYIGNKWADRVIAVSNYDRDFLIRRGLDKNKISVIYNGISEVEERKALPVTLKGLVIGTAARLTKIKGINYLIEAFSFLVKKYRELSLAILGDGEERKTLENLTGKLGIRESVYFLGSIPNAKSYFTNFDIFVLPSLMDFLPISILEALSVGRAVVATKVGGIPEIIEDGKSGILVPAKDSRTLAEAIEVLIVDRGLREMIGENGYKRFREGFTVERMVEKTNEIYKDLI